MDRFDQRGSERGEFVLDARRRLGVRDAADESVRFQTSQRLGEHLAGDAADQLGQVAVAYGTLTQAVEHECGPLV